MKWDASPSSNPIRTFGFSANTFSRKLNSGVGKDFAALLSTGQNLPATKSTAAATPLATKTSTTAKSAESSLLFAASSSAAAPTPASSPAASSPSTASNVTPQLTTQRILDERAPILPAYMQDWFQVGKIDFGAADGTVDVAALTTQKSNLEKQIAAYNDSEWNYNDLWKSVALAGASPPGYISPYVSPGIRQGAGVTDQVDGVTIPRADLYYAHDFAAQTRQILRDGGTPTLPPELASNAEVKEKFDAYVSAFKAMSTFAGPTGLNSPGSPSRSMTMQDAMAIQNQLNSINAYLGTN